MVLLLEALYFFLPAGIGNIMPVLVKKLPFFNNPIYAKWFGMNKTWRGFIFWIIGALIAVSIQRLIGWDLSFFSYTTSNFLIVGLLLGLGSFFGDLIESFAKRRLKIKPGKDLFFWDQIDFIIGGLVFVAFYVDIGIAANILVIICYFVLHLVLEYIFGRKLNMKGMGT
jgi:CDP-2,3-bis-(O-geranylgeranyl)-sn-glycerol synthase